MPHEGGWSGRQREDAGRGLGDEHRGRGMRQGASGRDLNSAQVRDDALVGGTTVSWGCDVLFATLLPTMRLSAPPEDPTAHTVAHKVTCAAGGALPTSGCNRASRCYCATGLGASLQSCYIEICPTAACGTSGRPVSTGVPVCPADYAWSPRVCAAMAGLQGRVAGACCGFAVLKRPALPGEAC